MSMSVERATVLDHRLQLFREGLELLLHRDQVRELVGGDPAAGLACHVARTDAGQERLGLRGGEVLLDRAGEQF
jgi:hypothetical protein